MQGEFMVKEKILVADDEVDFLEVIKLRLRANGYDVVTAFNGEEALKKIRNEKPDALLLDIMMPGIDGLEILRQVRLENMNLPIFILTAFSNEERYSLANKFNATGYILKTSDLQKEIDKINSILAILRKEKK
jgi:DNA-binding response OmpR family regulator